MGAGIPNVPGKKTAGTELDIKEAERCLPAADRGRQAFYFTGDHLSP